ncbi:MAG: hypothetical protein EBX40_03200 [Gammaproteobacteria bacterium]|nr:hypothetical protein [Gammaproteobacteria bacterium]
MKKAESITIRIKLKLALRQALESLSEESGQRMNKLIEKALEEYIARHKRQLMTDEARKDILYLRGLDGPDSDEEFWSNAYDDSE